MSDLRFLCFGSGSSGNCFYYETPQGAFLLDAGIGIRKLLKYFDEYGLSISNVKAMFLTHDHIDHVRCASMLSYKFGIPMYATEGVWTGINANPVIRKKDDGTHRIILKKNKPVSCIGCTVEAFTVPHDSVDNVGYLITYGDTCIAHVTDVGHVTSEIDSYIARADYLVIEANYDEMMLRNGPYPVYLQQRIMGGNGHLSNLQSAVTIGEHIEHLQHVWLCHLSENNNTPSQALSVVQNYLAEQDYDAETGIPIEPLRRTFPSGFFDL